MFALEDVVMIHKCGAMISRSFEHISFSRKLLMRGVSLSTIVGCPGKDSICGEPGTGSKSSTSWYTCENGGMVVSKKNLE